MELSLELMTYLKAKASDQNVTQKMIAEHFRVSVPTVKRWYAGKGIGLEQVNDLCKYLGCSLAESLQAIETDSLTFNYTIEQERFFATHPDYLAFFDNLLRGQSIAKIANKYNLTKVETNRYLLKLDNLKLIELNSHNKFKLLVEGEPAWRKQGPLALTIRPALLNSFLETKKHESEGFLLNDFSQKDLKEIEHKIFELTELASRAGKRANLENNKTNSYGLFISLKKFRWSLDDYLLK